MAYLPHSDADRRRMLEAIGVASLEELLGDIPEVLRSRKPLEVPDAMDEMTLLAHLEALSRRNAVAQGHCSFLGAGVYDHFIPAVVPQLASRGEFLTAYTPYQPELSQGTLQAIFEFQTLICQLTGMEVANASMYDGASATAEAVLMAHRLKPRGQVLASAGLHPEYRQVLETYVTPLGLKLSSIPLTEDGRTDAEAARSLGGPDTCCIVGQSPNFYGIVEPWETFTEAARRCDALSIAVIAEALSLGLFRPPAAADLVAGEGQSFGLAPQYGGPHLGFFAAKERYLRQMPGRIVGRTRDRRDQPGFVLTLATREQHIRRQRATSNICTNHSLCALAATIYLCTVGKQGLRRLAELNARKAAYARHLLTEVPGVRRTYAAPHFNEFVITCERSAAAICAAVEAGGVTPGLPLSRYDAGRPNDLLVCVTEKRSRAEIERCAELLAKQCR
ncbi:MAG: aminomethyl-transferring glycine dehydrogenase subunit GcvPA [Candidatus Tectomicrobia bacterium]|nr:aminomethyl-transferring glycine dehydrogenase subunit GcvPA [Candidatus Tectomicrobia bacterium]